MWCGRRGRPRPEGGHGQAARAMGRVEASRAMGRVAAVGTALRASRSGSGELSWVSFPGVLSEVGVSAWGTQRQRAYVHPWARWGFHAGVCSLSGSSGPSCALGLRWSRGIPSLASQLQGQVGQPPRPEPSPRSPQLTCTAAFLLSFLHIASLPQQPEEIFKIAGSVCPSSVQNPPMTS